MILYKAIKYTIFDICINTVIEGIFVNLVKKAKRIGADDIVEGMFISKIVHFNMTWENCRILQKQLKRYNTHKPETKTYAIHFSFTKTTAPFGYATDTEERKYETISIGPDTYFIT